MKRKSRDSWRYEGQEVRVPARGAQGAIAVWVVAFPLTLLGVLVSGPILPFGSWIAPVALLVAFVVATGGSALMVLPSAGSLYVLEDRVDWRPRLGRSRRVFLQGAESVEFKSNRVVLAEGDAKIAVPYRFPGYKRVHGLLCERSEVFRQAQDLQLPLEVGFEEVERNKWAGLQWLWFLPLVLSIGHWRPLWVISVIIFVAFWWWASRLRPRKPQKKARAQYRLEKDCVSILKWGTEKRHASPRLKSVRPWGGVLVVRFKDIPGSLNISQYQVAYPLSMLKEKIEEWYGPRPEELPQQAASPQPAPPAEALAPDPWDVFNPQDNDANSGSQV